MIAAPQCSDRQAIERLDRLGGELVCRPGFASPAEHRSWFAELFEETPWVRPVVRLFGREHRSPRMAAWFGDPGAAYTYSGLRNEPLPWTPRLADIRQRVSEASGYAFNSVLLNLYRDGADSMGWHADDEPELGPAPVIASLSLGATRRFRVKHRRRRERRFELLLEGGSLLVMGPSFQAAWRHAAPAEPAVPEPRINLTFRRVLVP